MIEKETYQIKSLFHNPYFWFFIIVGIVASIYIGIVLGNVLK